MGNQIGKANLIMKEDRRILRRLAGRVAELAARPVEAEKRQLWYRHNALEPTRPVVFCDPEGGWDEIITKDRRKCVSELARQWELRLRQEIFWGESMGDDRVVEPCFDVWRVGVQSDWGLREKRIGDDGRGAYRWEAPLRSYDDLDKLRFPEITVDHEATERRQAEAMDIFGDLLSVRLKCGWWSSLGIGITADVIMLRGLEQFMLDMYDNPENLHRLTGFIRDGTLAIIGFFEDNGLLSLNNDGTWVGSGGLGYTHELPQEDFDGKHVRPADMWGFCESEGSVGVSPDLFEEFVFRYQLPILERFGLNCYGCCEPVDRRWHVLKKAPRLRRVSVSPWSDLADMAEKLGDRYIYSMKPNPADLAVPEMNECRVRAQLKRAMEITRNCRVEVIMKDNHTVGNNPGNVTRWCRIAREEAEAVG